MSARSPFQAEHEPIVRDLRNAHPGIGVRQLVRLVAQACELDPVPSHAALHRFMQAHGIEADDCRDWLHDRAIVDLVRRARSIARGAAQRRQALPSGMAGMERAVFVGDVSMAFHALLFTQAQRAGVAAVSELAEAGQLWLAEVQA
jgi:hypothetical protein